MKFVISMVTYNTIFKIRMHRAAANTNLCAINIDSLSSKTIHVFEIIDCLVVVGRNRR